MLSNMLATATIAASFLSALGNAVPISGTVSYDEPLDTSLEARQYINLPSKQFVVNHFMRNPNPTLPCMFYNLNGVEGVDRARILQIAHGLNAVTLYDLYYADNQAGTPFNNAYYPMLTYTQANEERDWFRYTSRIFAERCSNRRAYFLWNRQSPFYNQNSATNAWWHAIWATDEFDAIYRGDGVAANIQEVYIVNPTTGIPETTPAWTRGQPPPPNWQFYVPGAGAPPPTKKRSTDDYELSEEENAYWEAKFHNEHSAEEQSLDKRAPQPADGILENPEQTVFSPGQTVGWVPGNCSFHWTQGYFAPNPEYQFNIRLYDEEQTNIIGGVTLEDIPYGGSFAMDSRLPYTLDISTQMDPNDPVTFKYAGLTWTSADAAYCSTGGYTVAQYPVRTGDCSFQCNVFQ